MTKENFESGGETLSYSQKVELVESLFDAVRQRNSYVENLSGDFDTFAESFANLPEYREVYDGLENEFLELRKRVDETIEDKNEFLEQLIDSNEKELAEQFARMFQVRQTVRSRLYKLFGGGS